MPPHQKVVGFPRSKILAPIGFPTNSYSFISYFLSKQIWSDKRWHLMKGIKRWPWGKCKRDIKDKRLYCLETEGNIIQNNLALVWFRIRWNRNKLRQDFKIFLKILCNNKVAFLQSWSVHFTILDFYWPWFKGRDQHNVHPRYFIPQMLNIYF